LKHELHGSAAEFGPFSILVERLGSCQYAAASEEISDPMHLLEPAPTSMLAVELHVLAEEPLGLRSRYRGTLLLDPLADCERIPDLFPRLHQRLLVSACLKQLVALYFSLEICTKSHTCGFNQRPVPCREVHGYKENANALTYPSQQQGNIRRHIVVHALTVCERHNPFGASRGDAG
jgi:hypothetical protein